MALLASVLIPLGGFASLGAVRVHASTLTVTNANDSGAGSLRAALAAVQDGDTVSFASSLNGTPIVLTGGEIDTAKSYTIAGNGASQTIIDGNHASRVLAVVAGAVTISGVTVRNGSVALVGVNTSSAAGLLVEGGASLLVTNSTITGNVVKASAPGATALGAGLSALSGGRLTIVGSTVSGNTASMTGPGADAAGGGIHVDFHAVLTLVNSTVSGNTSAHVGGGISAIAASGVTVTSTTVADNSAPAGSGIFGAATLQDTIVANTPATNCSIPVASQGHNLETGTGCGLNGSGDVSGADPRLGPLQNNGGPTPTQAPGLGSPAIGAGGACPAVDKGVDQRGQPRKNPCDIGAVETAAICFPILRLPFLVLICIPLSRQ